MAQTAPQNLIDEKNDLSFPVIIKMHLRFIKQDKCFGISQQRKQAHPTQEALLSVAEPVKQQEGRVFFDLIGLGISFWKALEEEVHLAQDRWFERTRLCQAR